MRRRNSALPKTARDLLHLNWHERLLYDGLIAFFRVTGLWKHPRKAMGDLERMRLLDKVYWFYKTTDPVRRARRHSGLERHFEEQRKHRWALPEGFESRRELTLSAAGDLMHHTYLANSGEVLYERVVDLIFGADISMANLECPIVDDWVPDATEAPILSYDEGDFAVAKGPGDQRYTFLATACNHSLDFGRYGVESTIRTLDQHDIAFNGVNRDDPDAWRATVLERDGLKIGAVAYTFGLNAHLPPPDHPLMVNRMLLNDGVAANDFTQLLRQITDCKQRGVDFLIAHLHWGFEHEFYPTPEQIELAHHVAELGVDAIIGHHSHVVQPLEFYRTGRDPHRVVPIYYSLGNLISPFSAHYLTRSALARMTLASGSLAGVRRVYVKDATMVEVVQEANDATKTIRLTLPD